MALGYLIPYDPHGVIFSDDDNSSNRYGTITGTPLVNPRYNTDLLGTVDDLGIFSMGPLAVAIPAQKRSTVQLAGKNGSIDLSTVLTGVPVFENRTGSWEFIVDNNYPTDTKNWADKYEHIVNALHGKVMKVRLMDDPGWYYRGSIQVGEWKATHPWASVTISYELEPYKYDENLTTVIFDCTSGLSTYDVTVTYGRGINPTVLVDGETRNNSQAFDFNNIHNSAYSSQYVSILDFMPIIPNSILSNGSGNSYDLTFTLRNTKLRYERKALNFEGSTPLENFYGLQSFVMTNPKSTAHHCDISLGQNASGSVITTNSGQLELNWRNGRL